MVKTAQKGQEFFSNPKVKNAKYVKTEDKVIYKVVPSEYVTHDEIKEIFDKFYNSIPEAKQERWIQAAILATMLTGYTIHSGRYIFRLFTLFLPIIIMQIILLEYWPKLSEIQIKGDLEIWESIKEDEFQDELSSIEKQMFDRNEAVKRKMKSINDNGKHIDIKPESKNIV